MTIYTKLFTPSRDLLSYSSNYRAEPRVTWGLYCCAALPALLHLGFCGRLARCRTEAGNGPGVNSGRAHDDGCGFNCKMVEPLSYTARLVIIARREPS